MVCTMAPKFFYEALPYGCFLLGSGFWLLGQSPLEIFAGMLLFGVSAWQWILRTGYRRHDRVSANIVGHNPRVRPRWRRVILPQLLYELMPFIYIAFAYLISTAERFRFADIGIDYSEGLMLAAAVVLCLTGILVLLLRGAHRLAHRGRGLSI